MALSVEDVLHVWRRGLLFKRALPTCVLAAMPLLHERGLVRFHEAPLLLDEAPHWRFMWAANEEAARLEGGTPHDIAPMQSCGCVACEAVAQIDLEDLIAG